MQDVDLKDVYVYNKKKTALYKAVQCFYKKKTYVFYISHLYIYLIFVFILLQK